ncbi:MAG: phage holin family protein [Dehalococcoidia bacterium]|nr:phage holin family protein [Dehalococcoidia bacterium]
MAHEHRPPGPVWSIIIRLAVNADALCTAAWLIPGIHLDGWKAIVIAALIFGLINTFIKPLISIVTCLFQVLTLGLFTFVINAGMLYLTSWLTQQLDLTFTIDNFWSALVGAVIVSVVSFILTKILP